MKLSLKHSTLLLVVLFYTVFSCKKTADNTTPDNTTPDTTVYSEERGLSDTDLLIFENAGLDTITKFSDVVFPDNTNIQAWMLTSDSLFFNENKKTHKIQSNSDKQRLLLARMQLMGFRLTTRSNYTDSKQTGLAYVWNSKQLTPAPCTMPPKDQTCMCNEPFRGLDCSGMVYQMATLSGLPIPPGSTLNYEKTALWQTALNNSEYKGLIAIEYDKLPLTKIQIGDIVNWPGSHIGVVLNAASVSLFNSLGSNKYTCDINTDIKHGPIRSPLTNPLLNSFKKGQYKVLRILDSLYYNLTSDSVKKWKVNPQGGTTYCNQGAVNPAVAMDDIYIFNSNGTFSHIGGSITVDPNLNNCNDGGDYSGSWAFNTDQTAIVLGGRTDLTIEIIGKSRMIVITPDSKLDLIPY